MPREKGRTALKLTLRLDGHSFSKIDNAVRESAAVGFRKVRATAQEIEDFLRRADFLTRGKLRVA